MTSTSSTADDGNTVNNSPTVPQLNNLAIPHTYPITNALEHERPEVSALNPAVPNGFAQFLNQNVMAHAALMQQLQFQKQQPGLQTSSALKPRILDSNINLMTAANDQASQKPVVTTTKLANPEQPDGLNSIASVAVAVAAAAEKDNEKNLRLKKRRSQIAAASRKSRAKRKIELTKLKHENEALWKENVILTSRLRQLGENVPETQITQEALADYNQNREGNVSDESGDTAGATKSENNSPNGEDSAKRVKLDTAEANRTTLLLGTSSLGDGPEKIGENIKLGTVVPEIDADGKREIETEVSNPDLKQVEQIKAFFAARMNWFFTQLKSDTVAQFGHTLPFHVKQKLANLQLVITEQNSLEAKEKNKQEK